MRARVTVALQAGSVPPNERHTINYADFEIVDLHGEESDNWVEAKASIQVPEDAVKLAWFREV